MSDEIMLKILERVFSRTLDIMATNYALQKVLLKKGVVSQDELLEEIREAQNRPVMLQGKQALKEMFGDYSNKENNASSDVNNKESISKILSAINTNIEE